MSRPIPHIAVVTDEVATNLPDALAWCTNESVRHVELRMVGPTRIPTLSAIDKQLLDDAHRDGLQITGLSPGIFKGSVGDTQTIRHELDTVLPATLELAQRWSSKTIIVFGFERFETDPPDASDRADAYFLEAATLAASAGVTIAIENEPNFIVDLPEDEAERLTRLAHPNLRANWDPANMHWGGTMPTREGFQALAPHIHNLHVKDYLGAIENAPWVPVGEGNTPWRAILGWVVETLNLSHITLETHCLDHAESSRRSIAYLRTLLTELVK